MGKTNAMRQLEKAGICYETRSYECDGVNFDGCLVADQVKLPYRQVYKTLVTVSEDGEIVVCMIPVDRKLDLKALAAASKHKRLEMLPLERVNAVTGYLRGGCSPVGMKKRYPTYLEEKALEEERIAVSAGIRGLQMILSPRELAEFLGASAGPFASD